MRIRRKEEVENLTIGGADGPTSIVLFSEPEEKTGWRRLQQMWRERKRKRIEKKITPEHHSIEEVCTYLQEKYGFSEIAPDTEEYQTLYEELRLQMLVEEAPELLGRYESEPELSGYTEKEVRRWLKYMDKRTKAARAVPKSAFDIHIRFFQKIDEGSQSSYHRMPEIIRFFFELDRGQIIGDAGGRKSAIKKYYKIKLDLHRYYGVTEEDIEKKTERYENLIQLKTNGY